MERVRGTRPIPQAGFNVGYVGTVDFEKMHPDFVPMSAAVDAPGVRFDVYGAGRAAARLANQAEELGVADRFGFHGWADDVRSVFARLDVLGYPLREDNYSAAELVLQEAMYAGVPPVVLPYGGAPHLIEHGENGLIAADEDDYPRCIEALHRSPELRGRLAAGAREHARRAWAPDVVAARWREIYRSLMARPKTGCRAPLFGGLSGAPLFARTLGDRAAELLGSDEAIATASPALLSVDTGGILHYRRRYPEDPDLQRWAGLALLRRARAAA